MSRGISKGFLQFFPIYGEFILKSEKTDIIWPNGTQTVYKRISHEFLNEFFFVRKTSKICKNVYGSVKKLFQKNLVW